MINGRSIIVHHATFATPEGGRTLYLTVEEAAAYDSDPDAYVAAYLGLSVAEYSEWLDLRGMPLCGATQPMGQPLPQHYRSNERHQRMAITTSK